MYVFKKIKIFVATKRIYSIVKEQIINIDDYYDNGELISLKQTEQLKIFVSKTFLKNIFSLGIQLIKK